MVYDIEMILGMQVDCGNLPQGRVAAKPSPFFGIGEQRSNEFFKMSFKLG